MKVLALVLVFVLSFSIFTGCNSENDKSSDAEQLNISEETKNFMSYLEDCDYEKAIYCFEKDLYGNYKLENEASEQIADLLNQLIDDVLAGKTSSDDASIAWKGIAEVLEKTDLEVDEIETIDKRLVAAKISQNSFFRGKELELQGNYNDAINEYSNVIAGDVNYNEAQAAIARCEEQKKLTPVFKSNRYYFEQTYPAGWDLNQGKDGYYLKQIYQYADGSTNHYIADCGLVAQISPNANVKYSIYSLRYTFMRATLSDFFVGLVGESRHYPFFLNNLFIDNPNNKARENFVFDIDIKGAYGTIDNQQVQATSVVYNKIQFRKAAYTFTVDGVDWKGMMFVTSAREGFYVITLEAVKDSWDANYTQMENMLQDFRLLGWATNE